MDLQNGPPRPPGCKNTFTPPPDVYTRYFANSNVTWKKWEEDMKVVAFNGSARKQGNTAFLIRQTMKTLGVNMAWLLRKLYG
jgi:hypothetical protein